LGCTVRAILGTISLPSAHSIDGKGRFKFGKVIIIIIIIFIQEAPLTEVFFREVL
jgi:hypothetical protein